MEAPGSWPAARTLGATGTRRECPRPAVRPPPAGRIFESASFGRRSRTRPAPYPARSAHSHGHASARNRHRRYAQRAAATAEQRAERPLRTKSPGAWAALAPPCPCDPDRMGGRRNSVPALKAAPLRSAARWARPPRRADFGLQDEGGAAARQGGGRSLSAGTDLRQMGWRTGWCGRFLVRAAVRPSVFVQN